MDDLRWMGLTLGRRRRGRRQRRPLSAVGAARHLRRPRASADRSRPRVLLLLLRREARSRAPGDAAAGAAAEVCRHVPGDCRRTSRARAWPAARRPSFACACPAGREVTFHDIVRGPVTFHTDVIGDPGARPVRRHAGVQLRRRRGRCADAGDACGSRRGPHFEHAATGAAVRGVRMAAAGLCAPVAGDGSGSHAALEAARRHIGRRVPREGLSAGGAGRTIWR